jgi:pimeloyl-ACP methyl ester carboxylesterase
MWMVCVSCLAAGESGSAVLLLHGGGLDFAALSWEEVIGPLSEKHRVFAPDLPGYGQSDKPAIQYTVDYCGMAYAQISPADCMKSRRPPSLFMVRKIPPFLLSMRSVPIR